LSGAAGCPRSWTRMSGQTSCCRRLVRLRRSRGGVGRENARRCHRAVPHSRYRNVRAPTDSQRRQRSHRARGVPALSAFWRDEPRMLTELGLFPCGSVRPRGATQYHDRGRIDALLPTPAGAVYMWVWYKSGTSHAQIGRFSRKFRLFLRIFNPKVPGSIPGRPTIESTTCEWVLLTLSRRYPRKYPRGRPIAAEVLRHRAVPG
jgi:hypothetical protein